MDIRGKSFSFVIVTIMFVWQIFLDYFLILWTTCAVCVIAVPGHVGTVWEFPLHAAEHGGVCETAADHRHSDHRLPRPRGCRLLLMPSSVHICNQCKSLLLLLSLVISCDIILHYDMCSKWLPKCVIKCFSQNLMNFAKQTRTTNSREVS